MNDSDANEVIGTFERLKGMRGTWESHWEEVARLVLPEQANFTGQHTPGQKRTQYQFDSTPPLALARGGAAVSANLTPTNEVWHALEPEKDGEDDEIGKDPEVKRYLEVVNTKLFNARYSPTANFQSQFDELLGSDLAFGTGCVYVDEMLGISLRYKSIHLAELQIMENAAGVVDRVYRGLYKYTARQATQRFGERNLPPKIVDAFRKTPEREFEFIHCVMPNSDRAAGRSDYRGMEFASYHVSIEGRMTVGRGGYRTMPYIVSRYATNTNEVYGRGPAMRVLPDIKMINEMEKTLLRAGQRAVDPPILLADDGALQPFSLTPGALNPSMVSPEGKPLAIPFESRAQMPLGLEMSDQKRRQIESAFNVDYFQQLFAEKPPNMTATEALLRAQFMAQLMAPAVGRKQTETLGPMITRELDLLAMAGQFPPMPDALRERGGLLTIKYKGPAQRAAMASKAVGVLRTVEAAAPLMAIDQSIGRAMNMDVGLRTIAEANDAPADFIRSPDELAAMDEQQAQTQQLQTILAAAQPASQAALNLAKAQQVSETGGAPLAAPA